MDRFDQLTWPAAVQLLQQPNGAGELILATREAEESDPAGHCWPRGKAKDDATVAVVSLRNIPEVV